MCGFRVHDVMNELGNSNYQTGQQHERTVNIREKRADYCGTWEMGDGGWLAFVEFSREGNRQCLNNPNALLRLYFIYSCLLLHLLLHFVYLRSVVQSAFYCYLCKI
jgi:hypothetical protein